MGEIGKKDLNSFLILLFGETIPLVESRRFASKSELPVK